MPGTAMANAVEMTETQQSIFNAPAPGTAAATSAPRGLPAKPPTTEPSQAVDAGSRGQKRARDEEDEEEESDEDVAMEEDSDDE
jgi:U2 small nuclear ribonucleoprotein B''